MGRAYQNKKLDIAKTSDAKAKVYSKYGREIYVCAKSGGVEPDGNLAWPSRTIYGTSWRVANFWA